MDDTRDERIAVEGHLKWFDPSKGFGFIVSETGGPDILLHANVLRNFGQSSIAEGARLRVRTQTTPRGIQAFEVLEIVPPAGPPPAGAEPDAPQVPMRAEGPFHPARVKWFDKVKGFGFANVFGRSEDVFVHVEVLRRSGLAELQAGEAVAMRVSDGDRGRLATEVATWECGAVAETADRAWAE
ncbi:cold-shock protein [Profundibacterium mesophilum]|uniref:Cold shock protein n=1 Tax=Profundibacterium mesophilum KAUST100406-0324 TaxID=1037889 RepID=A0A921NRW5_9RHOB|nr:cold shock domain-containing protein [Profundibacterium mesophilum]KAF0676715.1 Cold shock protein [Profundibacterium mesophilum KAUST100406-0324]